MSLHVRKIIECILYSKDGQGSQNIDGVFEK